MEKTIGIYQGEGIGPENWEVRRLPFGNAIIESHNGQLNICTSTEDAGPMFLGDFQEFIILAKNEKGQRVVLVNATITKNGIKVNIKP